jgi:hypothetical protein
MRILRATGVPCETAFPFSGLSELLCPLAWLLGSLPAGTQRTMQAALGVESLDDDNDRFAVFHATLELLARAGEERPVLCVIDDVQWFDQSSIDALLFSARRLDAQPVGMLLACRDEADEPVRINGVQRLRLTGLDEASSVQLLEGRSTIARAVALRVANAAGGNPLALVELPSVLSAEQLAGRHPVDEPLPVGEAVERVFLARVRTLGGAAQHALLLVATCGVESVATILSAGADAAALDEAERSGPVHVNGNRLGFRHPLVRSAVYYGATAAERRAAHLAISAVLLDARDADRRAWHLAAANPGLDDSIAAQLEAVAARAGKRGGVASKAMFLHLAARLTVSSDLRSRRLLMAAAAAVEADMRDLAESLVDDGLAEASDPIVRADLHLVSWLVMADRAHPAPYCAALVREAERIAGADATRAANMLSIGFDYALESLDLDKARSLAERAWDLVGREARFDTLPVVCALAWQRMIDGHREQAITLALLGIELWDTVDEPELGATPPALTARRVLAELLVILEQYSAAEGVMERMVAVSRRAVSPSDLAYSLTVRALLYGRTGRAAEAHAAASEGVRLAGEGGGVYFGLPTP